MSSLNNREVLVVVTRLLEGLIAGVSSDTPRRSLTLEAVSIYSAAINCTDLKKRRWTLIKDEAEFLPRSILSWQFPVLRPGERITLELTGSADLFDPTLRSKIRISQRWFPLLSEWASFIHEQEMENLGRETERDRIEKLSGMGPGLTPAGDDFIAGWIVAQRSIASPSARTAIREFCAVWQPERTTWLSKWMILDAIRGRTWKRGKDLLSAMSQNDGEAVSKAAAKILNWGHTSGKAWLAGLARGFFESRSRLD